MRLPRLRLRFRLQTLMVLVAIVGCALGAMQTWGRWGRFRQEAALHAQEEREYTARAVESEEEAVKERETLRLLRADLEKVKNKLPNEELQYFLNLNKMRAQSADLSDVIAAQNRNFAAEEAKKRDELLRRW